MGNVLRSVHEEIERLSAYLIQQQHQDGSWRFCFENGIVIDAYVIILFRVLNVADEDLIRRLHDRILDEQRPDGFWSLYPDEKEGNLSATVEAYYALLYSGYSKTTDEPILRAKRYIQARGGLGKISSILTKAILAATGQRKWPLSISSIPLEVLLFPKYFPINYFEFSGYSRVHLTPMLVMADRRFAVSTEDTPDLSDLMDPRVDAEEPVSGEYQAMQDDIQAGLGRFLGTPRHIHETATSRAEQFMLQRIESDGTLYSYASSTILMVLALLALDYDRKHPLIAKAVQGLTAMQCKVDGRTTMQNSPSTVWDTALITYVLQEAGTAQDHMAIQRASDYLVSMQQDTKADWSIHNPDTEPGGWPAFEKNTNKKMLTWLAIDGAKSAAIDPSEADLTGRTLEFLGNFAGLDSKHTLIQRGTKWLVEHQEKNGSWYGRWGVCYIYGTWAALTGLKAAGLSSSHETLKKGAEWLLRIQNADGGWGESCQSDRLLRYVPLGESTPSHTAWALDALIACETKPTSAVDQGILRLITSLHENDWKTFYPTGAGLPGNFYSHYHSYRYIWPLLALSHYKSSYGEG